MADAAAAHDLLSNLGMLTSMLQGVHTVLVTTAAAVCSCPSSSHPDSNLDKSSGVEPILQFKI
jgi:hypothetical protein